MTWNGCVFNFARHISNEARSQLFDWIEWTGELNSDVDMWQARQNTFSQTASVAIEMCALMTRQLFELFELYRTLLRLWLKICIIDWSIGVSNLPKTYTITYSVKNDKFIQLIEWLTFSLSFRKINHMICH